MSANMNTAISANMSTVSSTPMETMPSWMSISHGETIGTDHPTPKESFTEQLSNAGSGFKGFFADQAKMCRIETDATGNPKTSLKKELRAAGRAFKGFFKDHAKMYRI